MTRDAIVFGVSGTMFGLLMGWIIGSQQAPRVVIPTPQSASSASPASAGGASAGTAAPQAPPEPVLDERRAADLERAAKEQPKDAAVRARLADLYYDARRFPQSIQWYEAALAIDPKNVNVSTDLAAAYYYMNDFDRALTTNIELIIKAIDWCIEHQMDVINLSLGTVNVEHRVIFEQAVARAAEKGTVLVAAREMSGKPSLPGCLPSVIGVAVDWERPRDEYRVDRSNGDAIFIASAYPRDIPGVPRERNMKGISFAVANMTGFVARARESAKDASIEKLKLLLTQESITK